MASFLKVWRARGPLSANSIRYYGTRQESKPWKQKPNRNPRLAIILTEDVHNLGSKGQIVKVKRGYGRNRLLPARKAVYVTPDNIKLYNAFEVKKGSGGSEIDFLRDFLSTKVVTISQDPAVNWAVFEQTISSTLKKQFQVHMPLDYIELENPITSFGEHQVDVRLDESTAVVNLSLNVVPGTPKTKRKKKEEIIDPAST